MNATSSIGIFLAVFFASLVEMVEALTIVVAAGTARSMRSALEGAGVAIGVLVVIVGVVGAPLIHYVPIDALRVIVGALLLTLGLSWLRKAILRGSGHKAPHDEDLIFGKTLDNLRVDGKGPDVGAKGHERRDPLSFAVGFKGVLLEGLEVVMIVISLGATRHRLGLASLAAGGAFVVVFVAGLLVGRQLREVPENTLKMTVGILLTSFGMFWVGEGAGLHWPGSDFAILVLAGAIFAISMAGVLWMKLLLPPLPHRSKEPAPGQEEVSEEAEIAKVDKRAPPAVVWNGLKAFGLFWWEFLIGDTPVIVVCVMVIVGLAYALRGDQIVFITTESLISMGTLLLTTWFGRIHRTSLSLEG